MRIGVGLRFTLLYGFFILVLYLATVNNTAGCEWDASRLAGWADKGLFAVPYQQTHLLQTALNAAWCGAFRHFGYGGGALLPLRILSCIFGAAGAAGFLKLLYIVFEDKALAIFGSLGLAFSVFYWGFSTDLETHLLPTSLFIWCLVLLFTLRASGMRKAIWLGFIHSISTYLSGIYLFFIPAVAIGIIIIMKKNQDAKRPSLLTGYLSSVLFFWFLPFFIIGLYFYKTDPGLRYANNLAQHIFIWFRGFERISRFSLLDLFKVPVNNLRAIHVLTKSSTVTMRFGLIYLFFYAALSLAFIKNHEAILRRFSNILSIALALILPYQIILLVYEPLNSQRYTHLLPAFWLVISIFSYPIFTAKRHWVRSLPFIFIIVIFFTNFLFYIYPRHIPDQALIDRYTWHP